MPRLPDPLTAVPDPLHLRIAATRDPQRLLALRAELEREPPAHRGVHAILWQLLGDRLHRADALLDALAAHRRASALRRTGPRCQQLESLLSEAIVCERLGRSDEALAALTRAIAADGVMSQAAIGALRFGADIHRERGDEAAALRWSADATARHERMGRLLSWERHFTPLTWHRDAARLGTCGAWALERLLSERRRRVWIPGALLGLEPFVFCAYGLDVVATDVSRSVVDRLLAAAAADDLPAAVARALAHEPPRHLADRPGTLRVLEHDPIEPFEPAAFDAIFTDYLYQHRLGPRERQAAARVFAAALRPGGSLFVGPLTASSDRERLELAVPLFDAGFMGHLDDDDLAAHLTRAHQNLAVTETGTPAPKLVFFNYSD